MKKKPDLMYQQSSVIPFVIESGEIKIVLITSLKSGKWIIPKGVIEPGLSAQESAANEALEEAGLMGTVYDVPIGCYQFKKWGGICNVQVFPFRVEKILDEWEEMDLRQRIILPYKDALERITNPELVDIIKKQIRTLSH
jgi:8-oxo-dGTP pyrophosphatase MutT (NUDIX family)